VSRDAYLMMKAFIKFEVDTSYMAGHVVNPSTKFDDPTAIHS